MGGGDIISMKIKKICRVCGKEYETCPPSEGQIGIFRWRDVACSPKCGSIYLKELDEARKKAEQSVGIEHSQPDNVQGKTERIKRDPSQKKAAPKQSGVKKSNQTHNG